MLHQTDTTMTNTTLTQNEIEVLAKVALFQVEDGFSEFNRVSSDSEKGVLGSLVKKKLIYDGYEDEPGNDYMFCLSEAGFEMCKELNISTEHIITFG